MTSAPVSRSQPSQDELRQRAANLGLTVAEYDDLQIWIRHGRVGVGRTYQQEVERARGIEAERSAVMTGPSRCIVPGGCSDLGGPCPSCEPIAPQSSGVAR